MQLPELLLLALALWFLLSPLVRIYRAAKNTKGNEAQNYSRGNLLPPLVMLISSILLFYAVAIGVRLFFVDRLYYFTLILFLAISVGAFLDLVRIHFWGVGNQTKTRPLVLSCISLVTVVALLFVVLHIRSAPRFESLVMTAPEWPVRGNWSVAAGGKYAITNYHHGNPNSQNYAIDLIKANGASEGEPVYAPIGGVVRKAVNDREMGSAAPEGNLVVIETDEGFSVWLAHLQKGSLSVEEGEEIKAGELIGRCGATGSAEKPHLHIHAQQQDTPVPMFFGRSRRFLVRNDLIKGAKQGDP